MSTDLVSWLRQAMTDLEREANRDEPGCLCRDLGCHHTEARDVILRTVAAHRAILGDFTSAAEWADALRSEGKTVEAEPYARQAGVLLGAIRHLAEVYEDRPGFDPSWRADP